MKPSNTSASAIPEGWKVLTSKEGRERIVSPSGDQYSSVLGALRGCIRQGLGQRGLRMVRGWLVAAQGWRESTLLPPDWLYRVARRGRSGQLWDCDITFLAKDGAEFSSMRAVKAAMEAKPGLYNHEDLSNAAAFLRNDGTTGADILAGIHDSVDVAPGGLKKYLSNQKTGSLPRASVTTQGLEWRRRRLEIQKSEEDEEDDEYEVITSEDDPEDVIKTERDAIDSERDDNVIKTESESETRKVSKYSAYKPGWLHIMRPTPAAKKARKTFHMLRLARRPFVPIVKEERRMVAERSEPERVVRNSDFLRFVKSSELRTVPENLEFQRKRQLDLPVEFSTEGVVMRDITKICRKSRHLPKRRRIG